jgi:FMN-dependent NADH-azoreductase
MDKILFVNACIRPESRTHILAKYLLSRLSGQVEEVNLEAEAIPALNADRLKYRQELLAAEKFDDPMLRYARQFKEADIIVIAAPYYDLSFPSALKNYLEAICCVGLTFYYDENEVAQTHTRAKKLYYVSTGGGILKKQFGFEYVKALVGEFFHIYDVRGFFAEKLDLIGSDPERIMRDALAEIDSATCNADV